MKPGLWVDHLIVSYDKRPVLWDVTFEVPLGHLVAIIGPNGAGKSTLLKALLGLVRPSLGQARLFGQPIEKVQSQIAYVPQKESVDWDFPITVFELALMGTYGRGGGFFGSSKSAKAAALEALTLVGLRELADRQIDELSGGQKQRAFIARALCQKAQIYFMDEPFSGIDASSEEVILNILRQLQSQGKSIFIVHHDLETVARTFDWAILLNTHLIAAGKIEEVMTHQMIERAYGRSSLLLDRVARLMQEKREGRVI